MTDPGTRDQGGERMSQQDDSTHLAGNGDREGPAEERTLVPSLLREMGQSMVNGVWVGVWWRGAVLVAPGA